MAKSDNGDVNNRLSPSASNDPNNSFMKKVTSKVSGFLPTSLSKWFGESGRSRQVIRRREHDDDDDPDESYETRDESESHVSVQPPRKRARNMVPAPSLSETYTGLGFSITSTPMVSQPGPSGYVRSRPQYGHLDTTAQVHMNGDDRSDSGESSGYSSVPLPQHLSNEPSQDKELKLTSDINTPSDINTINEINSVRKLNKSPACEASPDLPPTPVRSLFSAEGLSPNPSRSCMSARRPSFNASTFGSPGFIDRTLSTSRVINSPFYSGRTMYGGSAAYQRSRLTLQNKPSIQIRPQPPPEESQRSHTNHLSKTAQRILDALESFNHSSVADAKKIPPVTNNRPVNKSKIPRKELIVPTIPDLLKMKLKERIQNTTVAVRNTATQSKSVLNTEYSLPTEDKQKHSNKIKNKVTSMREKPRDIVQQVVLPEVHLPITTLPKFDFSLPPPATVVKPKTPEKKAEKLPKPESQFKFSSPISVNGAPKSVISINNFKFSQPLDAKMQKTQTPAVGFKYVPPSNVLPKKKEVPKNNGQNDVSIQPAQQLLTGSVMDVLGKKNETKNDLMEKFKPASGSWECSMCMVRNTSSATRCVACESLKEPPKKSEPTDNFASQFKMSADKWECGVCMVRNDNKESKCVACTTPKPGAAPTPAPAPITSSWGDKFKPATDTWECGVCCVRNKSEVTKCVACETPKPGTKTDKPTLIMPPDTNKSGFSDLIKKQNERWECHVCLVRNPNDATVCTSCGTTKQGAHSETQFKFGLDKTDKNEFQFGVPKTTGFQFGVPATSSTEGFKFGDPTPANTSFTFGVKPTENKTEVTEKNEPKPSGFTFGVQPPKKEDVIVIDDDSSEKPTTVKEPVTSTIAPVSKPAPTFTFGSSSTPFQTPKDSLFGSKQDSNPGIAFGANTPIADAKKISFDIPEKQETTAPVFSFGPPAAPVQSTISLPTTIPNVLPSNTFSFGAKPTEKTEKPVTFGSVSTEKPTNLASTFQVPQFNFAGGLPFAPKTESSITTTTTTAPTFNFGGSSSFSAPKPTFNIGANKAEVKPFSFGSSEPPAKQPAFNFKENSKPVFNFSPNSSSDMFPFNPKPEIKAVPTFGSVPDVVSTTGMFGTPTTQAPPQNGGFNFGAAANAPNFKFGSSAPTQQNAPVFSFGQTGSASVPASAPAPGPAPAPVAFNFGSAPAAPTNTFSPDVRPNFNFSGGAPPAFTGQGGSSTAAPVRKIRKAVRRVQPR